MKISEKIKMGVVGLAVVLAGVFMVAPTFACTAADNCTNCATGADAAKCGVEQANKDSQNTTDLMGTLNKILNVVFGIIGFVAVVMLVYGGIQYTISSGDAGKVKKAKDTILYGIVGLIIALLAAAIVNFVLAGVFKA